MGEQIVQFTAKDMQEVFELRDKIADEIYNHVILGVLSDEEEIHDSKPLAKEAAENIIKNLHNDSCKTTYR